ncbi:MAG: hypothetical protein Q8K85_03875, partial [Hyphomicrobium sp.]|nr:hypothetical protein [Hyphomicrobium sp.]
MASLPVCHRWQSEIGLGRAGCVQRLRQSSPFMPAVNKAVRSKPKSLIPRTFPAPPLNRPACVIDRAPEPRNFARPTPTPQGETLMTEITHSARRHRARALLAGTMTALVAACSFGALAHAEDASIKEAVFDAQSTFFAAIVTVKNDGEKWTQVLPGSVGFDARLKVDTRRSGYVEQVGLWLGDCNGTGCGSNPRILFEVPMQRDYDVNRSLSFPVEKLLETRSGATNYRDLIMNSCNARPATEAHSFKMTIDATFSANTRKAAHMHYAIPPEIGQGFNGGDVTRHDTFEISVDCLGPPRTTSDRDPDPNPDPHRTKVTATGIDLFLQTFVTPAFTQHGPSGTQCKPLKVTTRVATDKAGPVNVKLWRQVNGGAITGEGKQMHAEALGGSKFGDDWNQIEHFTQTTTVQYKAEVLGGTFGPSTKWKSITIHCNGDFASPQSNANPDNRNPPGGSNPPSGNNP